MKIKRIDTTYSTEKLQESKDFYLRHFGFLLAFESDWYVELVTPDRRAGISFTLPQREAGEFFNGRGVILSFEVEDADAEYARLQSEGVSISQPLEDKPWGERSFVVNDPNGLHIYIYAPTRRTEAYEKRYAEFKPPANPQPNEETT